MTIVFMLGGASGEPVLIIIGTQVVHFMDTDTLLHVEKTAEETQTGIYPGFLVNESGDFFVNESGDFFIVYTEKQTVVVHFMDTDTLLHVQ